MAAAFLATVKEINRLINQYDPPKDLGDAPGVTNIDHGKEIRRAIIGLFGAIDDDASKPTLKWTAKGRRTQVIKDKIMSVPELAAVINDKQEIIRIKHSTGHNPAPEGLYFAQDNGPTSVVSNPKIILTPGSIADRAGKTQKESKHGLYEIRNLVKYPIGESNTLPVKFTNDIAMELAIDGSIKMTIEANGNYKLVIPSTLLGEITEIFDNVSLEPTSGKDDKPSYFAGNPKKNVKIGNLIDSGINDAKLKEIQKYLLCKELGDTLQVIWLNHIFNLGGPIIRGNTVVGTTDETVLYRCVVNGVGVIQTVDNGGKTYIYMPKNFTPEEMEGIIKQKIVIIQKNVIGQNLSVIKLLKEIIASPNDGKNWIETTSVSWNGKPRDYANDILTRLVSYLEIKNNEINTLFDGLSGTDENLRIATGYLTTYRFRSPFVDYKGKYYKIVQSVKSILKTSIPFDPTRFVPRTITGYVWDAPASGGGHQSGGAISDEIEEKVDNRLETESSMSVTERVILAVNIENGVDPLLLFCFTKEFFPELFTYAEIMLHAFHVKPEVALPAEHAQAEDDLKNLITEDVKYKWIVHPDSRINGRFGCFDIIDEDGNINKCNSSYTGNSAELFRKTKAMLKFADLFVTLFPSVKTGRIAEFLRMVSNITTDEFRSLFFNLAGAENAAAANRAAQEVEHEGGGNILDEELQDQVATIAIANYELYYESALNGAHKSIKIKDHSPVSKTQRATKSKVNTGVTSRTRTYVRNSAGTPQRKTVRKVSFVEEEPMPGSGRRRTRRKGKTGSKTRRRA